jgi:hypothetical protein
MTKIMLVAAVASVLGAYGLPARADCRTELDSVKIKLTAVKDEPRREELAKLAEKAEFERGSGRERLCIDAIERAKSLLK